MTHLQKVKLPLNYDPPQFYCPACGAPVLGNFDTQICEHLVFVSDPGGSGMDLIGEKYSDVFEKLREEIEKTDNLIEKFLEKHGKDSFLAYDVEVSGISHSVECYNITALFDFAP